MHGGILHNPVRLIGFILTILILLAAVVWLGRAVSWPLAAVVALAGVGWGTAAAFGARLRRVSAPAAGSAPGNAAQVRLANDRLPFGSSHRLQALLTINRCLAEAASGALDERGLMNQVLREITGLVGALGCSFVPVDEWRQALPAFTFGQLPDPVLNAWSTHLASHHLRERCAACQVFESSPGACPLHPAELGGALTVYCLPLARAGEDQPAIPAQPAEAEVRNPSTGRTAGVLHLYLPAGQALDQETRIFLDAVFGPVALAYEAARLRAQEQVTLRQLRMLRAPEDDFTAVLEGLLDGLLPALDASFVLVRLRPAADERFSNLTILRGSPLGFTGDAFEAAVGEALESALSGCASGSLPNQAPVWLSLPLSLPETASGGAKADGAGALGVILVVSERPRGFHPRQEAILQTVAAQAALLIEHERTLRGLEYRVVIQERVRLAREIHDGLAQTLAFLKLQAAQMQSSLAQGDTVRLSRLLSENSQTLAEAYLDTRQAIDNLRLTPQEGLEDWLERSLAEFEISTGLRVERSIQPLAHPAAPEIQAQLVRIIQEALTNIRKHAHAHTVRFNLREWQGQQIIEIADDGLGFSAEDVPEISRHGLRGMRERAEWIGADFQITSQPRQGTIVRLLLPIPQEEEAPQ